jgi:hypothetical protein
MTLPIWRAVDPRILWEGAIRFLDAGQSKQRTHWRSGVPSGQQRAKALDQIPRPDQVIATRVFVGLGLTPGRRKRRDKRPLKVLVLMGQEHAVAQAVERAPSPVFGDVLFVLGFCRRALPLRELDARCFKKAWRRIARAWLPPKRSYRQRPPQA